MFSEGKLARARFVNLEETIKARDIGEGEMKNLQDQSSSLFREHVVKGNIVPNISFESVRRRGKIKS